MKEKKCLFCGKMFKPNSPKQNICKDEHYWPCPDCGTPVKIKESYQNFMKYSPNGRRCEQCRKKAISSSSKNRSNEEKQKILEKVKSTNRARYGCDWFANTEDSKKRHIEIYLNKYGVTNLSQSPDIQKKIHDNSLAKYGVNHYSQDPNIRANMISGMIDKYGVPSAQQCKEIRDKTRETNLIRYGVENVAQSEDVKLKMKETCLTKYGVEYALQASEIRDQIKKTCYEKYGCFGYPNQKFMHKLEEPEFKENYSRFIKDPRKFILDMDSQSVSVADVCRCTGLDISAICAYCEKYELWDIVSKHISFMEGDLIRFIKSINPDIVIQTHNRQLISPYEIDIYLPEYKIGIECNPTYTHNSSLGCWDDPPKSSTYHKIKSLGASNNSVFLFHIFGYEWKNKRNIIESMLLSLLGKTNRVYARQCTIREVPFSDAMIFLSHNHRQGQCNSKIRIGLYYHDELVSLMTFNKPRATIGKSNKLSEYDWELVRFCSKLNTTVVGGASKLFKYFTTNYKFEMIYSFSDISHTKGNLYDTLGFKEVSRSEPNYVWVDYTSDSYLSRVKCQKQNLRKLFDDDSIDIENKTEKQIMEEHGYVQVFDSGNIRWEYRAD